MGGEERRARTFSPEEVVVARMALRRAGGAVLVHLSLPEFVNEIREEIDLLREDGFGDEEIVVIVERAIGPSLSAQELS
jgi:hypothetical protein